MSFRSDFIMSKISKSSSFSNKQQHFSSNSVQYEKTVKNCHKRLFKENAFDAKITCKRWHQKTREWQILAGKIVRRELYGSYKHTCKNVIYLKIFLVFAFYSYLMQIFSFIQYSHNSRVNWLFLVYWVYVWEMLGEISVF